MKNKEQEKRLREAAEAAFEQYKSRVGDYYSWEYAIEEENIEDFCKTFLELLNTACQAPETVI
jgi:hypothetical protein